MIKQLSVCGLKKRTTLYIVILVSLLIGTLTFYHYNPANYGKEYYTPLVLNEPPRCMHEVGCKRFYQTCSNTERKNFVKEAFLFSWKNYQRHAWGHDHLKPETEGYDDDLLGLGATLIDSLSTIVLLGLQDELKDAREWLSTSFHPQHSEGRTSLFEVAIRVIGSLVSTYHLTGDRLFLDKAQEIGDLSLTCFNEDLPYMSLSLSEGSCNPRKSQRCLYLDCLQSSHPQDCKYYYCKAQISEIGTLGLEFRALSAATGDMKYWEAVNRTNGRIFEYNTWDGLVSRYLYTEEGRFVESSDVSTGPGIDSYYEYLLKQWLHSNSTATRYRSEYMRAVEGVRKHLMVRMRVRGKRVPVLGTRTRNITLSGELHHLSCFLPGTLALGYYYGLPESHLQLAKDILWGCYYLYTTQPTGLAAELTRFKSKGAVAVLKENYLRPETVESLFVLWRVTGEQKYRDMGWNIFQAFERTSRTCHGYSAIHDVCDVLTTTLDKMESFFLAETLKYLYLLFEEDSSVLPLGKWVFNTEAHPLPILTDIKDGY